MAVNSLIRNRLTYLGWDDFTGHLDDVTERLHNLKAQYPEYSTLSIEFEWDYDDLDIILWGEREKTEVDILKEAEQNAKNLERAKKAAATRARKKAEKAAQKLAEEKILSK